MKNIIELIDEFMIETKKENPSLKDYKEWKIIKLRQEKIKKILNDRQ